MESRYERTREAAAGVLAAVGEVSRCSPELQQALTELQTALAADSDTPAGRDSEGQDPARHLISLFEYEGKTRRPIGLDEHGEALRRQLATDRTVDPTGVADGNVVLTELRGMVIGGLLRELAARLTMTPNRGAALAAVVTDLSWELLDQTFVGRQ